MSSSKAKSSSKIMNESNTGSPNAMLAKKYQKKTDKEHVLDTPDTYTGSMTTTDYDTFVLVGDDKDKDNSKIIDKQVSIVPGLYKIFDEAIVNTRDQSVRMRDIIDKGVDGSDKAIPVTEIDITINKEEGIITLCNNGNGIDVAKHPTENIWIPELIFAHLRTSTNYDKEEKKTTDLVDL